MHSAAPHKEGKVIKEAVMSNRKKSALDLTTQLFVGRLTTPADELMSAFPHTDPIDIRTDRDAQIDTSRSRIQP